MCHEARVVQNFFSKVDSIVSEFKIKCNIVMLDAQIFSRVQTRLPSEVRKEMKLCKRTCGKNPNWHDVKKMVVEAFEGDDSAESDTEKIEDAVSRPSQRLEAYAAGTAPRKCFNCNKFGHLAHRCPDKKRESHYQAKKIAESHAVNVACVKCLERGHLAISCPYRIQL